MQNEINLQRFTDAHHQKYAAALREIRAGRKRSHWMWYIFPQMRGLGFSATAHFYGIQNLEEAKAFLCDPYLGGNLREISEALLQLETSNASLVFGYPDDLKLHSSMTLFAYAAGEPSVFHKVLDKYFGGEFDSGTKRILHIP